MAPGQVPPLQVEDQRPVGTAWAELEEEHEKNRNHPIPVDDWMEPGFYAFNSVMGSGKTAVAAHKAKLRYSAGWPVFHASTSGANRENAFSDSSTSMRKDKLIFVGASASKRLPPPAGLPGPVG